MFHRVVGTRVGFWLLAWKTGDVQEMDIPFSPFLLFLSSKLLFSSPCSLPEPRWMYGGRWGWLGRSHVKVQQTQLLSEESSSGDWKGWYAESDYQCEDWNILVLRVGEAGSTPGLCAGSVNSHGFTKEDKTDCTLNVALQISNSKLMICLEHNSKSKCRASRPTARLT